MTHQRLVVRVFDQSIQGSQSVEPESILGSQSVEPESLQGSQSVEPEWGARVGSQSLY